MPRRKITTKIENGKVVFSKEILEYFENIRTEDNNIWINKYFEVLSDKSNLTATKYRKHHIRPCFSFKDDNHKNRRETQSLGDEFNGNIIKVSVYNHILCHYYLWKIFDNWDSKSAVIQLCKEENIKDLSEFEIKEIARIIEESTPDPEDVLNRRRKAYRDYNKRHKEKREKYDKEYHRTHKKERQEYDKKREIRYRERRKEVRDIWNHQLCYDPINNDTCTLNTLRGRKYRNKEKYKTT